MYSTEEADERREVPFWRLSYSQRQLVRSHCKTQGPPIIFLMVARGRAQLQYLLLRLDKVSFWWTLVSFVFLLVAFDWVLFLAAGEGLTGALKLSLDANDLWSGRELSCEAGTCAAGVVARVLHFLFEVLVGAVLVVRLSRGVTKRRFVFSDVATLDAEELKIRVGSNRPSNVMMPCFQLEWFDQTGKLRPLHLTNGGTIALLHDGVFFLRHKVTTPESPFHDPDWRDRIFGIRIAVMGYDEVLSAECSSYRFYRPEEIVTDADFDNLEFAGKILNCHDRKDHDAVFVHLDRISKTSPRTRRETQSEQHHLPLVVLGGGATEDEARQRTKTAATWLKKNIMGGGLQPPPPPPPLEQEPEEEEDHHTAIDIEEEKGHRS